MTALRPGDRASATATPLSYDATWVGTVVLPTTTFLLLVVVLELQGTGSAVLFSSNDLAGSIRQLRVGYAEASWPLLGIAAAMLTAAIAIVAFIGGREPAAIATPKRRSLRLVATTATRVSAVCALLVASGLLLVAADAIRVLAEGFDGELTPRPNAGLLGSAPLIIASIIGALLHVVARQLDKAIDVWENDDEHVLAADVESTRSRIEDGVARQHEIGRMVSARLLRKSDTAVHLGRALLLATCSIVFSASATVLLMWLAGPAPLQYGLLLFLLFMFSCVVQSGIVLAVSFWSAKDQLLMRLHAAYERTEGKRKARSLRAASAGGRLVLLAIIPAASVLVQRSLLEDGQGGLAMLMAVPSIAVSVFGYLLPATRLQNLALRDLAVEAEQDVTNARAQLDELERERGRRAAAAGSTEATACHCARGMRRRWFGKRS